MADSSPFDLPEDIAPAHHVEDVEDEDKEEEEEEDDDPFAAVDSGHTSSAASQPAFDTFSSNPIPVIQEETPLSIWEKERAQILADRAATAQAEKQRLVAQAKEELSKFYADQEAKLDKTKKVNRADEKNFRSDTAAVFAHGSKWEKVNKLVNVQPKPNEKPGSSRVERYRKLLLQLKVEKDKKKTAA